MVWGLLFTLTAFVSAALLFVLQPLFARMLLPMFGGAPAVWNTALVFYQTVLLAAYAYAHVTSRRLTTRQQILLHVAVMGIATLALPIALPRHWLPATQTNPIPSLLAALAVSVGLPLFAISATSPLLQRWFSTTTHRSADNPYFLYAASNLGSLLALAAYPTVIEPNLGLLKQSHWWSIGYGVFIALMIACALGVTRVHAESRAQPDTISPPLSWQRRLRWLALAFVPCSLMLSVTTYITTEIAPIPLLWVIPLGIYLLSFVVVFARRKPMRRRWAVWLLPPLVIAIIWSIIGALSGETMEPLDLHVTLHLIGLFVVAMLLHGELANDRPPADRLTEFYLWISVGGVLGGVFNALLAPQLFPVVMEYPLTLVLACALMPTSQSLATNARTRAFDVIAPLLLGLLTVAIIFILRESQLKSASLSAALTFGVPTIICLCFSRRPFRLALGVTALLLAIMVPFWIKTHPLCIARSFFGIHRVTVRGEYHYLQHGTTIHGSESFNPERRDEPLSYYSRGGPLGDVLGALPPPLRQNVAIVGLGAGTIAAYGGRGQQWTFYEIDPTVERIARNPQYFTYLSDSLADVRVELGDARLSLQRATDGQFGVMILDPYDSDSPPLHLLTKEALALYLQKLAPDGVLAFHISTRHLDLKTVLANLARDAHVSALTLNDFVGTTGLRRGICSSRWLVMSRDPARINMLATSGAWTPPRTDDNVGVWTDDHTSLFRIWSWY